MLDALRMSSEMQHAMEEAGIAGGGGFGRRSGPPDTPQARMRAAARSIQQVYRSLNGGGVRPGSLYPPTQTMRNAVTEARRVFEKARRALGG